MDLGEDAMTKQGVIKVFAAILTILLFPAAVTAQQVDPAFNPNMLVDDKVFADTETFGGPEGVQKFLESRGSVLANTNPEFLIKLKEPVATLLKQGLEDPQPNLGRLRTAAELVWDASRQSGLNPQVILVTLNKEQSLITGHHDSPPEKLQKALDRAMGFDCPDATGCGELFPGFYYQLFGNYDSEGNRYLGAAKSLMRSYNTPTGRGPMVNGKVAQVGDIITLDNTLGGFLGVIPNQTLTLMNRATAALYRFTPHVFNGNYNFWRFFNDWFRYPNGTLIKLANDANTYIVQNGTKQLVPAFVAQSRSLNLSSAIVASPNEYESYPTDKVLGPQDDTVIKVTGNDQTFVFSKNVKHPASAFVIGQRGLDPSKALTISPAEASLFEDGPMLTPKDGTILRGEKEPAVYLVSDGALKMFSAYTFGQRKITPKQIVLVPDAEVATYQKQGFVAPLDNTLVKSPDSATVYLMENGLKRPLTGELFKNRGLSFKQIVELSKDEVAALPIGAFATPKDRTFFQDDKTHTLYIYKEGAKHKISSYVAKQRGITPDYTFSAGVVNEWLDGIPIPPRDNTLVKGDKDGTVFLVSSGQLRPMTATAFKNRRYSFKKVVTLPQAEVDAYAKGEVLAK